jgi:hypothetical protein
MMASDIYEIPAPDSVPDNPAQLYEWDRVNSVLCAEWVRFWERIGEHEREMVAKHGAKYKGVRRADACRAFRVKIRAKYNATDPSDAWCTYDDERRRTLDKPPRTVFKSGPQAQSREHLEPHWGDR